MNKHVVAGLFVAPLLVGAAALLGSLSGPPTAGSTPAAAHPATSHPIASHPATSHPIVSTPAPVAPTPTSASVTVYRPDRPPQLQVVLPPSGATALTAGRWAVCYTYADARGHESVASPRYILIVPTGADIRIASMERPTGVSRIDYYVSPAVNVVLNLRRYAAGEGADVIVSGPGTGPVAP